jgi:hypothetical protein
MKRLQPAAGLIRSAVGLAILLAMSWAWILPRAVLAFEPAEVRAMVANSQDPAKFPGAGGIWLGLERVITLNGEGNAEINEHRVAQVFDPQWAERTFEPLDLTYWSQGMQLRVRVARVWHSLEKSEDLPRDAVVDSLHPSARGLRTCAYFRIRRMSFPRLVRGDRVEIAYQWIIPIEQFNLNMNWFAQAFGAAEPVVEQRLILNQPSATEPVLQFFGPVPQAQIVAREGFRQRLWDTGNLPGRGSNYLQTPTSSLPLPGDSLGPEVPQVLMTMLGGWGRTGTHYGAQWEAARNRRCEKLDQVASGMMSGHPDLMDRARACESYLREQIRTVPVPVSQLPLRPFDASEVMDDGAGTPRDKTCLLVSLLWACSIPAYPVLLRNHGGVWAEQLPCPAQLDRYVVVAQVRGKPALWLDASGECPVRAPSVGLPLVGEGRDVPARLKQGLMPFPGLGEGPSIEDPANPGERSGSKR